MSNAPHIQAPTFSGLSWWNRADLVSGSSIVPTQFTLYTETKRSKHCCQVTSFICWKLPPIFSLEEWKWTLATVSKRPPVSCPPSPLHHSSTLTMFQPHGFCLFFEHTTLRPWHWLYPLPGKPIPGLSALRSNFISSEQGVLTTSSKVAPTHTSGVFIFILLLYLCITYICLKVCCPFVNLLVHCLHLSLPISIPMRLIFD